MISKEKAARTALAIIDKKGLDGFKLLHVATKLKVQIPSLYHHFKNRAELMAEVARVMMLDTHVDHPDRALDWKEMLLELQVASRRAMLKHPNAAPLLLQFLPRNLMLEHYDRYIGRIGASAELHMTIIEGLEKLTFGSVLFSAMMASRKGTKAPEVDPRRLPNLSAALDANPFDDEEIFRETVRRYLSAF